MKKLGVIGGLGPMATAFFMQMVIEMTEAKTDQEHIEMLIHNCPAIPDRTSYILGKSEVSPKPQIVKVGQQLAAYGVDVIAIPCVTANYFYEDLQKEIDAPIIDIIGETVKYLVDAGVKCAGIMATDGTIQCGIFQRALEAAGIMVVTPNETGQQHVMHLIYQNVKATKPAEMERFTAVSEELRQKGAEVIILGCTELSMIRRDEVIGAGYLDAMQVLAKASVEQCGILKEAYKQLITKE